MSINSREDHEGDYIAAFVGDELAAQAEISAVLKSMTLDQR